MAHPFKNDLQRKMYDGVIRELHALGYSNGLLLEDYDFSDWFATNTIERRIHAAAFGETPISYDSSLFGVVVENGTSREALVSQYRALCAPIIFEISSTSVREWVVGRTTKQPVKLAEFGIDGIAQRFAANAQEWSPLRFLRSKNIGDFHWNRQLDLFSGLLPELEEKIKGKLDPLLRDALSAATAQYRDDTGRNPDEEKIFQLVFFLLTGKVFHDRGLKPFADISLSSGPDVVLAAVAAHYKRHAPKPLTKNAREKAFQRIWRNMDFRNLSVEILTTIWSETLLSDEIKEILGIHRTPRTIAKYIVDKISFIDAGGGHKIVLEPCCGSGVFLVAAMNRLRPLLWGARPEDRHAYFIKHLVGFEKEPFGVEIGTMALALADFPNANGWEINADDIFGASTHFEEALSHAGVVLCNPPFERFSPEDRIQYRPKSAWKPVELLNRVLDHLHPQGVLGFVLPRNIIDGQAYRRVRKRLAARFASIDITSLPDRAFEADHEVALIIATDPLPHAGTRVTYHKVADSSEDWTSFSWFHKVSSTGIATLSEKEAAISIAVPELPSVWSSLKHCEVLEDVADVHRGIEWTLPLFTKDHKETGNRDKLVSATKRPGFKRGVAPQSTWNYFEPPVFEFLNFSEEFRRGNAHGRNWDQPKVILNKSTRSRGNWRISAFADHEGVACYQTFIAIWPQRNLDIDILSAILNGPVANAFVTTREGKTDITLETLKKIPIPQMTTSQTKEVRVLLSRYISLTRRNAESALISHSDYLDAEAALKAIDAAILAAYDLSPRNERDLLDFFRGDDERPVAFPFSDYFPPDFEPRFSLMEYLSDDFKIGTAREFRKDFEAPSPDVLSALKTATEAFRN